MLVRRSMTGFFGTAAVLVGLLTASPSNSKDLDDLREQCSGCHVLTKPMDPSVDRLWSRKGPDLWYAGVKFNREWLVQWLQHPALIRPGGVLWFNHAKPGEPRDTIDNASLPSHPTLDAKSATEFADALMQLKPEGLVQSGAFKAEGANLQMGQMSFAKLRGCIACHQDKQGQGGLSGPSLADASHRLQPDFIYAYIKDPQAFDRFIWMPRLALSEADLQRLTAYIASLGKEDK